MTDSSSLLHTGHWATYALVRERERERESEWRVPAGERWRGGVGDNPIVPFLNELSLETRLSVAFHLDPSLFFLSFFTKPLFANKLA